MPKTFGKKYFGKDRKAKIAKGDPNFKKGHFDSTTFWKSKTQKAAIDLEKKVFHGVNSLKLQETALKAKTYDTQLKKKQEELEKIKENGGLYGKIRGRALWRIRSSAEVKAKALANNARYLKAKKEEYDAKSTELLKTLQAAEVKKRKGGDTTGDVGLVKAESLANALAHIKTTHDAKMTAAKTAKQAEVDKLGRLVSEKTTVDSAYTKATKDYYDVKDSGKVIYEVDPATNLPKIDPKTNKPVPMTLEALKKDMKDKKAARTAFYSSPQTQEIKDLARKLKSEKKIQYISAQNLGNVARGSKRGIEVKNKSKSAAFAATETVRQLRKDAQKGRTMKKIRQYASKKMQGELAERYLKAQTLLKTPPPGGYTRADKKTIKQGIKAKAMFGVFARTGIKVLIEDPEKKAQIESMVTRSQKERNEFIKDQAPQIAVDKAARAVVLAQKTFNEAAKGRFFGNNPDKLAARTKDPQTVLTAAKKTLQNAQFKAAEIPQFARIQVNNAQSKINKATKKVEKLEARVNSLRKIGNQKEKFFFTSKGRKEAVESALEALGKAQTNLSKVRTNVSTGQLVAAKMTVAKAKDTNAFFRTPDAATTNTGKPLKPLTPEQQAERTKKLKAISNSPEGQADAAAKAEKQAQEDLEKASPEKKSEAAEVLAQAKERTKAANAVVLAARTPEAKQARAASAAIEEAKKQGKSLNEQTKAGEVAIATEIKRQEDEATKIRQDSNTEKLAQAQIQANTKKIKDEEAKIAKQAQAELNRAVATPEGQKAKKEIEALTQKRAISEVQKPELLVAATEAAIQVKPVIPAPAPSPEKQAAEQVKQEVLSAKQTATLALAEARKDKAAAEAEKDPRLKAIAEAKAVASKNLAQSAVEDLKLKKTELKEAEETAAKASPKRVMREKQQQAFEQVAGLRKRAKEETDGSLKDALLKEISQKQAAADKMIQEEKKSLRQAAATPTAAQVAQVAQAEATKAKAAKQKELNTPQAKAEAGVVVALKEVAKLRTQAQAEPDKAKQLKLLNEVKQKQAAADQLQKSVAALPTVVIAPVVAPLTTPTTPIPVVAPLPPTTAPVVATTTTPVVAPLPQTVVAPLPPTVVAPVVASSAASSAPPPPPSLPPAAATLTPPPSPKVDRKAAKAKKQAANKARAEIAKEQSNADEKTGQNLAAFLA
jgi:hypothetical protein